MFDRALGADSFYTPFVIDSVALSSPESMVAELPLVDVGQCFAWHV